MQRLSKDGHAHSVTADTMKRLRLPQIAILVGAGVAACSDYCSGPKLPPRVKVSPKAAAMNKLVAIMELPRGASIPTRALEPWHTLGLLASSLWSGGLPPERAIDLGFVFIKGATEDASIL
ncbi:hypothetical protein HaLaN_10773 [Haematococcus lacustris]|uniref:Uncharacterized protein n=1 Tax=Haematococcus lacustris TaxID=44745 RepID=A0A699YYE2_HAELA|nr:hypothetical protein HaLaN_10773 [Haematococcus lacustris]